MNVGAFGENFPYSNFHDLNTDWIIKIAKDFLDQYTHIQEVISNGEESLQNLTTEGLEQLQTKADTLEALLQQWYNTHSEDIANQLASAIADLNSWYNEHSADISNELAAAISNFNQAANDKAELTIQSIPQDYSALVSDVTDIANSIEEAVEWTTGKYIDVGGEPVSYEQFKATLDYIPLYADDLQVIKKRFIIITWLNNATYVAYYNKNKTFLNADTVADSSVTQFVKDTNTLGEDVYYIRISCKTGYTPHVYNVNTEEHSIGRLIQYLPAYENNLVDTASSFFLENKYINWDKSIINLTNYAVSNVIPVFRGCVYKFNAPAESFGTTARVARCSPSGEILSVYSQPITNDVAYFTAPFTGYIRVNLPDKNYLAHDAFMFCIEYSFNHGVEQTYTKRLYRVNIGYNGDSICQGRDNNGYSYPKLINDIVHGFYSNRAVGGATLAVYDSGNHIVSDVTNMPNDCDIVCFEGGINDYWHNIPLGDTPDRFDNSVDITTICGAVESIIRQSLVKWLGKPIVFIIPHKIRGTAYTANSAGYTMQDVHDKIMKVCKKYGVTVLDMFDDSELNSYINEMNNAYMTGNEQGTPDGTHPNEAAYKDYYVPRLIEIFNKMLKYSKY